MSLQLLAGDEIVEKIKAEVPGASVESCGECIAVDKTSIAGVMRFLKGSEDFDFNYLNNVTAVDRFNHFEVVYNLTSFSKKHSICIKTRVPGRENPEIASVAGLWQGADFQEREIYDLMGIRFVGHPNLKRIALWEAFEGHPLRKDFL